MWTEPTKSGKVKFVDRYVDPLTMQEKKISVTLEKDTARNRKLAAQMIADKIDKKLQSTSPRAQSLTLRTLADLYLEYQEKTVKKSTYKRNYHAYNVLCRMLGESTLVKSLTAGYIRRVFSGEKIGTANERLKRLKAMLRWGYENDYVADIRFLDKLKPGDDEERKRKLEEKYLEQDELLALLDGMSLEHWRNLTEFLALSGLRIGEAIALEMADVDLQSKTIIVTKTYDPNNAIITTAKTYASQREVYIQPELEDICRKIRIQTLSGKMKYGYDVRLFMCGINGEYLRYYAYNKYLKEKSLAILGREITPHTLRHTHTSLMAAAGVPLEIISRRLGHESSDITRQIYLHVTEKLKARDREQIKAVRLL